MSLSITKTVKTAPKLPYEAMKDAVLGRSYELTLNFVGEKRARSLNMKHRKASYIPNVLSFPLTETLGEIYIAPEVAAREAIEFNMSKNGYIGFLFIHGLLHLKGLDHGATMERAEKKYVAQFGLK